MGDRPAARFRLLLLAVLVCCALPLPGCSDSTTGQRAALEDAPDFKLDLFGGGEFRLSAQRGRVVVINFFASWCVSCGEETPALEKLSHKYAAGEVVFLAIAVDDTEKKARAFMNKAGLTIAAGLDKSGQIKDAYGLYGMPTTFFIDRAGKMRYFHAGVVTEELMRHEIDKLL